MTIILLLTVKSCTHDKILALKSFRNSVRDCMVCQKKKEIQGILSTITENVLFFKDFKSLKNQWWISSTFKHFQGPVQILITKWINAVHRPFLSRHLRTEPCITIRGWCRLHECWSHVLIATWSIAVLKPCGWKYKIYVTQWCTQKTVNNTSLIYLTVFILKCYRIDGIYSIIIHFMPKTVSFF